MDESFILKDIEFSPFTTALWEFCRKNNSKLKRLENLNWNETSRNWKWTRFMKIKTEIQTKM